MTLYSIPQSAPGRADSLSGSGQTEVLELPSKLKRTLALVAELRMQGDLEGARDVLWKAADGDVLDSLLEECDAELIEAGLEALIKTAEELGSLETQLRLREVLVDVLLGHLPEDHPRVLLATHYFAATLYQLRDFERACDLWARVHVDWEAQLPADHPDLWLAKQNIAACLAESGSLEEAIALQEQVLLALQRLLPGREDLHMASQENIAAFLMQLGDYQRAQELQEPIRAAKERLLPSWHPDLLRAKENLALMRLHLGDVQGALELQSSVHSVLESVRPSDDPDLVRAKENLALSRIHLGSFEEAFQLMQVVVATREQDLPPDHPDLVRAMRTLAGLYLVRGESGRALELQEAICEQLERRLSAGHFEVVRARLAYALMRCEAGDIHGALELLEEMRAAMAAFLPGDHPTMLAADLSLVVLRMQIGDLAGARAAVHAVIPNLLSRSDSLLLEAPRVARAKALQQLSFLSDLLSVAVSREMVASVNGDKASSFDPDLFALLESLRIASVARQELADVLVEHPDLEGLVLSVRERRAWIGDLAAAVPEEKDELEAWQRSLFALTEERDRAEGDLRQQLAEAGAFVEEIDARNVAARLAPDAAVVSFLRYPRQSEVALAAMPAATAPDSLLAFVVRSDASVERVELGSAEELEVLVGDWRGALGRPLAARGGGKLEAATDPPGLSAIGERLRQRILDPVLALVPNARVLHLVLDDLLYLVPLDALPLEEALVGERLEIRSHATLAELLHERPGSTTGSLLAAGGIDYEAELAAGASVSLDAATPPLDVDATRSGSARAGFLPLTQTVGETAAVAALYELAFELEATVLSGAGATKAALLQAAPQARFLHLATHGWFASEAHRSHLDSLSEGGARDALQSAEETLVGFAPETLCGLALAGANRGTDALGRVPGILTAEELAAFDLRNCELAVLSACETNVGIRRAGQGIQSLQTALHAAGVRTAITSLWKVDDAATRRLFELFYAKLWQEGLGKAEALWQAKLALRSEGHPPRDWAGWVLSGEAE